MDRVKLAKILQLSTSTNENEALSAIRRANEMLKRSKMSWSDLLSVSTQNTISDFTAPEPEIVEVWDAGRVSQTLSAITFCLRKTNYAAFKILGQYLHQHGHLTNAQDKKLWEYYNKLANGKRITREEANSTAFPFEDFKPFQWQD